MTIVTPYDWRVIAERPGKRVLARVEGDDIVFCEEWVEDGVLAEARAERDRPQLVGPDLRPIAVIPPSEQARAMKEGWFRDDDAWRRWANDIDNRSLRTTDGRA